MKITKFSAIALVLMLMFSIISCDDKFENDAHENAKVEAIKNLTGESQKIAFKMLSKEYKYNFWLAKLNRTSNRNDLNNAQKSFIQELISTLRVEYFDKNASETHSNYYKEYLSQMSTAGKVLFTKEQMSIFFSNINDFDSQNLNSSKVDNGGGSTACNCSSSDDWCTWGNSCFVWSCGRSINCGWWLEEECNGLCVSKP